MFKNLIVSFFLAIKSIKRGNLGTTILTIVIMSLVFVNLIFLPSIILGIGETMNRQAIDYSYANLVIEPKKDAFYIDNVNNIQKKINRLDGVVGTSPRYTAGATFAYKSKFVSGELHSISPLAEEAVLKLHTAIIAGEYLSKTDTNEILLGIDLAGEEGKESTPTQASLGGVGIGDKIHVTFSNGVIKEYRVKGIFKTKYSLVDGSALITGKEMESVLGLHDKASQILVKLAQKGTEKEFRKKFMELGISEDIKTYKEKSAGFVENIVNSFDIVSIISTVVSLIIAIVVIFIVIYISVIHKKKQIGILKAIGINQGVIINSYLIQSLFYCFCGIIVGLFLLYFVTSYFTVNPIMLPIGDVKPFIGKKSIFTSITSLIIVSLIAGFFSSWKTAREKILKSIWG